MPREGSLLTGLLVLYVCASYAHFAHNAEYLADYPNLPAVITRSGVYPAWLGQTAIALRPHTTMMNFTISFEVIAATALLIATVLAGIRFGEQRGGDRGA